MTKDEIIKLAKQAGASETQQLYGGSGFCDLSLDGIRTITKFVQLIQSRELPADKEKAPLPIWWPMFIRNISELPDYSSPEDGRNAFMATPEELVQCAMSAIHAAEEE